MRKEVYFLPSLRGILLLVGLLLFFVQYGEAGTLSMTNNNTALAINLSTEAGYAPTWKMVLDSTFGGAISQLSIPIIDTDWVVPSTVAFTEIASENAKQSLDTSANLTIMENSSTRIVIRYHSDLINRTNSIDGGDVNGTIYIYPNRFVFTKNVTLGYNDSGGRASAVAFSSTKIADNVTLFDNQTFFVDTNLDNTVPALPSDFDRFHGEFLAASAGTQTIVSGAQYRQTIDNFDERIDADVGGVRGATLIENNTIANGTYYMLFVVDWSNRSSVNQSLFYRDMYIDYQQPDPLVMVRGARMNNSLGDNNTDGFNEEEGAYILNFTNLTNTYRLTFNFSNTNGSANLTRYMPAFRMLNYANSTTAPTVNITNSSGMFKLTRWQDYNLDWQNNDSTSTTLIMQYMGTVNESVQFDLYSEVGDETFPNVSYLTPGRTIEAGDTVNISENVTDDFYLDFVGFNVTASNGTNFFFRAFNASANNYTAIFNSTFSLGFLNVFGYANDTVGHVNNTVNRTFTIVDTIAPNVTNPLPFPPENSFTTGIEFSINATIMDRIGISLARINITYPNGTVRQFNATRDGTTNFYEYNFSDEQIGNYDVLWIVNDTSNNVNQTVNTSFSISLPVVTGSSAGGSTGLFSFAKIPAVPPPTLTSGGLLPPAAGELPRREEPEQPRLNLPQKIEPKKPVRSGITGMAIRSIPPIPAADFWIASILIILLLALAVGLAIYGIFKEHEKERKRGEDFPEG